MGEMSLKERFWCAFPFIITVAFVLTIIYLLITDFAMANAIMILFFSYSTLKSPLDPLFAQISLTRMRRNLMIDWIKHIEGFSKDIIHVILIPVYKEDNKLLYERIVRSINANTYPRENLIIIFVTEFKDRIARTILKEIKRKYVNVYEIIHPPETNIVRGKSSAMHYAGKVLGAIYWGRSLNIVKDTPKGVIEELEKLAKVIGPKIRGKTVIITDVDIDFIFPRKYFAYLTYTYLSMDPRERDLRIFQPGIVLINNLDEAIYFSQVIAVMTTYLSLAGLLTPTLINFSSYSLSLVLLDRIGYWRKDVIQEDSGLFWKAKMMFGKDFKVTPLFMPLFGDPIFGKSWKATMKSQWNQIVRWAFGVTDIKNIAVSDAPLRRKIPAILYLLFCKHLPWEAGFIGTITILYYVFYTTFFNFNSLTGFNFPILFILWIIITIYWILFTLSTLVVVYRAFALKKLALMSTKERISLVQYVQASHGSGDTVSLALAVPSSTLSSRDVNYSPALSMPLSSIVAPFYLNFLHPYLYKRSQQTMSKKNILKLIIFIALNPAAGFLSSLAAFRAGLIAAVKGRLKYVVSMKAGPRKRQTA